jgi:hypothetical protein
MLRILEIPPTSHVMLRSALLLLTFIMSMAHAAETKPTPAPKPTPTAPDSPSDNKSAQAAPIDPEIVRKAEAAADAYLQQTNVKPDPLAEAALADIEVLLVKVHAFLEVNQPLKSGECYLGAIAKRKTIDGTQRHILGKRLAKADADLIAVSRLLLDQSAFNLGNPPAEADEPPAK